MYETIPPPPVITPAPGATAVSVAAPPTVEADVIPDAPVVVPDRGSCGGRGGRGGCGQVDGTRNYKNKVLIQIVEDLRPYGSKGWALVSSQYREASEEDDFHDPKDLKDHWVCMLGLCDSIIDANCCIFLLFGNLTRAHG